MKSAGAKEKSLELLPPPKAGVAKQFKVVLTKLLQVLLAEGSCPAHFAPGIAGHEQTRGFEMSR